MGLSEPVTAAVDRCGKLIDSLVTRILAGNFPQRNELDSHRKRRLDGARSHGTY